jgi:hypothetical protein
MISVSGPEIMTADLAKTPHPGSFSSMMEAPTERSIG